MLERADYGKQTLEELSKELTKEFGKGLSSANLYNMRRGISPMKKSRRCLENLVSQIIIILCDATV